MKNFEILREKEERAEIVSVVKVPQDLCVYGKPNTSDIAVPSHLIATTIAGNWSKEFNETFTVEKVSVSDKKPISLYNIHLPKRYVFDFREDTKGNLIILYKIKVIETIKAIPLERQGF